MSAATEGSTLLLILPKFRRPFCQVCPPSRVKPYATLPPPDIGPKSIQAATRFRGSRGLAAMGVSTWPPLRTMLTRTSVPDGAAARSVSARQTTLEYRTVLVMIVPSFLYEYAGMRRPATKIWRPPGPKGRISAHAVTQPLGGGAAGYDFASIAQHDEQ